MGVGPIKYPFRVYGWAYEKRQEYPLKVVVLCIMDGYRRREQMSVGAHKILVLGLWMSAREDGKSLY